MEKEETLEVLQRWESTGLLTGLPPWEKEELALSYDNVTRVMLSKAEELQPEQFETLCDVTLPTTRRLYRRVGLNFDINNMVDELVNKVRKHYHEIILPATKGSNPIVEFCVEFADTYEDGDTKRKIFSAEQYEERVDKMLVMLKDVLLSDKMVSFVDRIEGDWKLMFSDTKKSPGQIRIWNQKRAIETLHGILNETNQGI